MNTALDAFVARKAEIDDMLEALAACSAEYFNCNPYEINWGDVGDLTRIRDCLKLAIGDDANDHH